MLIRHPYNSERQAVTKACPTSRTKQSMAEECDINNIVAKYKARRIMDHVATYKGEYGDFGDGMSFHEAQTKVAQAQEAFDTLPAAIRNRFQNDPAAFLDFVGDKNNRDEMKKMGLLKATADAHGITEPQPSPEPGPAPNPAPQPPEPAPGA